LNFCEKIEFWKLNFEENFFAKKRFLEIEFLVDLDRDTVVGETDSKDIGRLPAVIREDLSERLLQFSTKF
jgi:hypothetical protein